jgi:hypothetical protein
MRRFIVGLACSFSVLCACGDDGGGSASDTANGTTTTNASSDGSTGASSTPMTSSMTTETTGEGTTTDPTTTAGTTGTPGESKMEFFGLPCTADADCTPTLGADGKCLKDILGFYELPGGYCSILCALPDAMTGYVKDDPTCAGGGPGSYCISADGYFEGCVTECTDNSQCPREGYECRIMPQLGKDGDPKFCLMTDEHML